MKNRWTVSLLVLILGGLSGCISLERPSVEKDFYALDVSRVAASRPKAATGHLRINRFSVSPAYDLQEFVYQEENFEVARDYYHRFIRLPGALVTEETARWLADSGLFGSVSGLGSERAPAYVLEGHVSQLYGDFRQETDPKAVLEIRIRLLNRGSDGPDLLLNQVYRQVVSIPDRTPKSLVTGWNLALEAYLEKLEEDLAGVI
jgi:cholesterol transport system auxiliary component